MILIREIACLRPITWTMSLVGQRQILSSKIAWLKHPHAFSLRIAITLVSRGHQQMRGRGSPTNMSMTLVPPHGVRRSTRPLGLSLTSPMISASLP